MLGCISGVMMCTAQVWRFILEREVEAPERFQAIQSYRATMAVLRQQALFVEQLFDTGVIDEMEKEELLQCASPLHDALCPMSHASNPTQLSALLASASANVRGPGVQCRVTMKVPSMRHNINPRNVPAIKEVATSL